jgi:hypothetical protein
MLSTSTFGQGWEVKKEKEGIQVFTKTNPNSPFHLLKAECDLAANSAEILDLILDISKHKDWVYNTVQSVLIKRISANEVIYYGETFAPWPVSNRDLVIHLTAITDSTTGICTIKALSEPNLKPIVKGKVRVPRSQSVWKLIPINASKTHIIYTLDIDPGGNLPAWLVNYASVEGPYLSFQKMKRILLQRNKN